MKAFGAALAVLARVNTAMLAACRGATVALVGGIVVVVCLAVFFRYVLNNSLAWAEEVAKYLMVWMVFTGAPIALRQGGHVAVDMLPNMLPPRPRHLAFALVFALIIAVMLVFIHYGWFFAVNGWRQKATTVGNLPLFWIFVSVPVGGAVMALVALELMLHQLGGVVWPERYREGVIHDVAASVRE